MTLGAEIQLDPAKQALLDQFIKLKNDPLEFLKAVRTLDEVDRNAPIKHFPRDLEYLDWFVAAWVKYPFLAVPKSRRMKMSWINIALFLWDTMFNQGRNYAFVSKKEEDSDELVKRAKFIYDNLDPAIFPHELRPAVNYKYCSLEFPEIHSRIRGYPSGADQLRQFTFSGILGDECAFWADAQEMYAGAKPTLEGGGRFVMISSPGPGFFKRLVHDQLDSVKEFDAESLMNGKKRSPMEGVQVWKNSSNKFFVFELHYTADPKKRSKEWIANEKAGMPLRDWNREYELHWDSYEGLPVYADWNKRVHSKDNLEPEIGLPLLRGWDFGLTPACIVAQLQGRKLIVLYEFTALNMGVERFSDLVLPQCAILFPAWGSGRGSDWIDCIDPAGENRDQSNEGTCALVLDSKGLHCIAGPVTFEERRKGVEFFLTSTDGESPNLLVNAPTCPIVLRGFEGGYRFPETSLSKEPERLTPIKDEHSHPHDALQYIAGVILKQPKKRRTNSAVPRVGFAFNRSR